MMRVIYLSFLTVLILFLSSCSKLIGQYVNSAELRADKEYPPAATCNPRIEKGVDVNLENYKSVAMRNPNKDFAMAVAISGGSYRVANFALGALLGLEKMQLGNENMLQDIDYFSTASGGGLAAAYYITQLHNYLLYHSSFHGFSLNSKTHQMLWRDCTCCCPNPLRKDLMSYLFSTDERGYQVECILNNTLLATPNGDLKLENIFVPRDSGRVVNLPYWAINTTVYQNGAILPFTPDVLRQYSVTGYYHCCRNHCVNPASMGSIPVSVGLMASLSVPIALPSTTLSSNACMCANPCYLHLFDGAIADELGVNTALSMLAQDPRKIKVLLVIDGAKDLKTPYSKCKETAEDTPLYVRLTTLTMDGFRKHIKSHIHAIAKRQLCSQGASHVIVMYLGLDDYPYAQKIRSELKMSLKDQKTLLAIGQELVRKDKTLQAFIAEEAQGKLTIGQCS